APFYDLDVMRTCAGLPLIALERRNVVRFLFEKHFPALAKIPHDKEWNPILPNLPNQLYFAARRVPRKLATLVLREDRVLKLEERYFAWRERDIWRMSFGAATPGQ